MGGLGVGGCTFICVVDRNLIGTKWFVALRPSTSSALGVIGRHEPTPDLTCTATVSAATVALDRIRREALIPGDIHDLLLVKGFDVS